MKRFFAVALAVVSISAAGCKKEEEPKLEPQAPTTNTGAVIEAQTGASQGKGQAQVQVRAQAPGPGQVTARGGNDTVTLRAADGRQATLQNGKVVEATAPDGRQLTAQPKGAVEAKAEDGRKVIVNGDKVVLEDPTRPGAKIVVGPNGVDIGNGQVTIEHQQQQ